MDGAITKLIKNEFIVILEKGNCFYHNLWDEYVIENTLAKGVDIAYYLPLNIHDLTE